MPQDYRHSASAFGIAVKPIAVKPAAGLPAAETASPPEKPPAHKAPRASAQPSLSAPDSGEPWWLCIRFDDLARRIFDPQEGRPHVVIENQRGKHLIFSACPLADAEGICPGMSLNAARALVRDLQVDVRNIDHELQHLQQQAEFYIRFTPTVSIQAPDRIVLEVSRSVRFFGGFQRLLDAVNDTLDSHTVLTGASTAAAASLISYYRRPMLVTQQQDMHRALGNIPISELTLSVKTEQGLYKCGVRHLQDLWRLPRADLARRFGRDLIDQLDRLQGNQPDPRYRASEALRFARRITLPAETDSTPMLMQAAARLLTQAEQFLRHHGAAAESIHFVLWHRRNWYQEECTTDVVIHCQQADRRPGRFLPQLDERLHGLRIEQPVEAVSLHIDRLIAWQRQSEDLFCRRDRETQSWSQLVEILQSRLGDDQVVQLQHVADHCPEYAWQYRQGSDQVGIEPTLESLPSRPLWLMSEPVAIAEPAAHYELISDGERIRSGWWRQPIHRDYHAARACDGSWHWLYRDLNTRPTRWYRHGLFG
ncbi:MAG: DNA polymerase Y family protein [Pseudomonadota bacterium]